VVDPRTSVVDERLKRIRRIIAVSSGKGGVGKSLIATTLSIELSKRGQKVGLFDLDFTSPSTHLILGAKEVQPVEDKGLIPPKVEGLYYMSLVYYSRNEATPLRGSETSNALIELLAVTLWGELDYLIIDTPPGIGDAMLDLIKFVPSIEFLIVTTPSRLAFETVKKQISLLQELNIPILGVLENMVTTKSNHVRIWTEKLGVRFLAEIPFDPGVEAAIGDTEKLLKSMLAEKVGQIAQTV
jgi:ATP-binding protein involved in chromosome partitioning